ncbi:MAG TPA: PQQ-dependent sugar dehydrogenase [Candidatus Limnocylindria bacterium]
MSRVRLATLATLVLSLTILLPAQALAAPPTLSARVVQDGLTNPWDIAFAPGGQMFVSERPGRVRVYASGRPNAALVAISTIPNVHAEGEAGVMGIAVDPLFSTNRFLFVCASRTFAGKWRNQVIRYRVRSDWKLQFNRFIIKTGMVANTIHNGCAVQVGPDQKLWVTMGEANHQMWAQDPNRRNGKVMRINRDGTVPTDNPIWPGHSKPTIVYSIGHRNPQGITFQPGTGRVYVAEHGPDRNDEINWIRPGRNYGWPCVTGHNRPTGMCSGTFTLPAWSSGFPTLATSGCTFVNSSRWGTWDKHLFVSTLKESDLRRLTVNPGDWRLTMQPTLYNNRWGRLRAAVMSPGGRLFLSTSNGTNDKVIQITPS